MSPEDLIARWPLPGHPGPAHRLLQRYAEPHRTYHDRRHLAEVLDRVDRLLPEAPGPPGATPGPPGATPAAAPSPDRDAVVLAAWFHDAVYDTDPDRAGDNEERSAVLVETELAGTGVPPATVAEIARLVRLTATHRAAADDPSGAVLCDADLGILAADRERYDEYAADVRREYAHVSDEAFRQGRVEVLRRLLALDPLFRVAPAGWEQEARDNMTRELAALDGGRSGG